MRRLVLIFLFIPSGVFAFEVGDCSYGGLVYGFTAENKTYTETSEGEPPPDPVESGEMRSVYTNVMPQLDFYRDEKYEGVDASVDYAIAYNGVFYGKGTIKVYSYVDDGVEAVVDETRVTLSDLFGSCYRARDGLEDYLCAGVISNLSEGYHLLRIKYFQHRNKAKLLFGWDYPDPSTIVMPLPSGRFLSQGIMVEYYKGEFIEFGENEEGKCKDEVLKEPRKDWPDSRMCTGGLKENWSSRWTGYLLIEKEGNYRLCVQSDEKARLYIDDILIIDAWDAHPTREDCNYGDCGKSVYLTAGAHGIHIQHYEKDKGATLSLGWGNGCDGKVETKSLIPAKYLVLMGKKCKEPPKPFSQRVVEAMRGGGFGCELTKGKMLSPLLLFLYILLLRTGRREKI